MNQVGPNLKADHPKNSVAKDVSKDTTLPEFRGSIENQTVGGERLALPPSSTDRELVRGSLERCQPIPRFRQLWDSALVVLEAERLN